MVEEKAVIISENFLGLKLSGVYSVKCCPNINKTTIDKNQNFLIGLDTFFDSPALTYPIV